MGDEVRSWWRRPVAWVAAAVVLAAVAVLVGWRVGHGNSGLTARGEKNRKVFTSAALADFAGPWLNDLDACGKVGRTEIEARGAVEAVTCHGPVGAGTGTGPVTVTFRRYDSVLDRNKAIDVPKVTMSARPVDNSTIGNGDTMIVWAVPNDPDAHAADVYLIYWDVPGKPLSAELDAMQGPKTPARRPLEAYWWAHQPTRS